jgi:hypothetical protein
MTICSVPRRQFLAAVPLIPFAASKPASPRRERGKRGRILLCRVPAYWKPADWRDTPPSAEILEVGQPIAMGRARKLVKFNNRHFMRHRAGLWQIVSVTDGRLAKGGAA